jgi:hypothetical protein
MCGGGAKVDNSSSNYMREESERARREEEARKAKVEAGTARINDIFSQFGDEFYKKRYDAYMNYYTPQLADQFGDAQKNLTFALANAGTLNSTVAADKQAELQKAYDAQRASIVSQAEADRSQAQTDTQSRKSALISQLNTTADADAAANSALAQSKIVASSAPQYDTLGNVFAGLAEGVGGYYAGRQNANIRNLYGSTGRRTASRTVG